MNEETGKGLIINVRGAPGSGKTELSRRILETYGWRRGTPATARLPGYVMSHPGRGRPLAVLGCYARTSGGCDTIGKAHGGLPAIFETTQRLTGAGYDVLMEGLSLSAETEFSKRLARKRRLHVLHLATPPELCGIRLSRRRRRPAAEAPVLGTRAKEHSERIEAACATLDGVATVERLHFDEALTRACLLMELPAPPARERTVADRAIRTSARV